MNFTKFFFSHQTEPITQDEPEQIIPTEFVTIRQDFTLANLEQMTIHEILMALRTQTINFVENNYLTWGATELVIREILVQVKQTENQDIVYIVDEFEFSHPTVAATVFERMVMPF